jgi:CRP-like cAMP-binding protein
MVAVVLPTIGDRIVRAGRHRSFAPGELLFVESDHSRHVYAVVEGRVRVFLTTPSGRELLIGIKTPCEHFGELSALDGQPRSASAAALDRSVVAELRAEQFLDMVNASPELMVAVCQNLSAQLRRANTRLLTRNSDGALVRTGRMLVELASLMMRHTDGCDVYEVPITQAELADWIGATRESTARALARFRKVGFVETCRGRIVVIDVPGLSRFVAEY